MGRISEAIIRHVRRRKTFEEEGLSENDAWDLAEKMFDSEVRKMNYLSVCSGIEAATMAWHDLGWKPAGFSEIEPFPSAVLAHHYPDVTNFGDMTKFKEWNLDTVNLLVGGTPCQSFSVAGLRKGLEDPRGNLALTYCGILDHFRPKWFVWENVPGVLSSGGGRDFGSFLGAVAELGYGFAYRVLDAQYFGVAQRRKRVFVVGCFGDWQSAAKVLFEPESLRRDSPPSRDARKEIAATITARFGNSRNNHEELAPIWPANTASTLNASFGNKLGLENQHINSGAPLFVPTVYETHPADSRVKEMGNVCQTVTSSWGTGGGNTPFVQVFNITFCDSNGTRKDRKNGGLYVNETDTSNTLTRAGVGTNIVQPLAADIYNQSLSDVSQTVRQGVDIDHIGGVLQDKPTAYGFLPTQGSKAHGIGFEEEQAPTLRAGCDSYGLLQTPIGFHVNARPDEMKFEDDLSGTMTKSQIPGVLETYSIQGSMIGRSDEAGPQGNGINKDVSFTLNTTDRHAVAHPIVLMDQGGSVMNVLEDGTVGTLRRETHGHEPSIVTAYAFDSLASNSMKSKNPISGCNQVEISKAIDNKGVNPTCNQGGNAVVAPTLTASNDPSRSPQSTEVTNQVAAVYATTMAVRRLTPVECERLQGFPDNYTNIPWRKKPESPDGPRYKALGNSMAVPVMEWIGKRIQQVENKK